MNTKRILVTGAGGFLGSALLHRLVGLWPGAQVTAVDIALPDLMGTKVRGIVGSIADTTVMDRVFDAPFDAIFHLASIPGGLAETDYALGHSINIKATHALLHRAVDGGNRPRFVFASSIAVYGSGLPALVDDATPVRPASSYGTAKVIGELLVEDLTRRGAISGVSLRLPGIVARPSARTGAVSIFLSDIIRDLPKSIPVVVPVSPDATVWLMLARTAVDHLVHAASIEGDGLPGGLLMPALRTRIIDLVTHVGLLSGRDVSGLVTYEPDPAVETLFGRYPPLDARRAITAGFAAESDLRLLIEASMSG